jgi:hypothetical protein
MFGALALLPLYLQIVKGSTPTEAGLQTLPLVLGIMSMSIFSGQFISRTGRYKIWPVIGLSLMIVGIGLLSRIGVDTPYWRTALIMVLVGWGLGANMQPLTLAVQNAMPPKDMGVATASATFFRQMGGTLGTAVFLSILFSALPGRVVDGFRAAATDPAFTAALRDPAVLANPANQPVLTAVAGGAAPNLDDSSFLSSVDPVLARPILEGFASSMSTVFLSAAVVLFIGLFAVLRMKEVPLRTMSGVEAQREVTQAAAAATAPVPVKPAGDRAEGPRPWRRARPAGGDGARAVVGQGLDAVDGRSARPHVNGSVPDAPAVNGAAREGAATKAGGPVAAVLPPAPSGLAPAEQAVTPPAGPPTDARDRLLAMLLPDPARAVALIADAEQARDAGRRVRREAAVHGRALDRAADELVAQGLTSEQVCRLLELTDEEAPDRRRAH